MNKIYLDNAATTPLNEEVIDAMISVMRNQYGNPSSIHSIGQEAKSLIEETRRKIAKYLNVTPSEIIFTSCGTESNNMIIKSSVDNLGVQRIISSPMEHKCVTETCLEMKNKKGVELVYVKHLEKGEIDLVDLEKKLQSSDKKTLVSLMHANNEVGNLLDIEKVSEICKKYKIPLFLDGARLAYGLMAKDTDVTLPDIARLCDVFYFGGTKAGALLGEAIVFTKNNTPKNFVTRIKQHGALLAKGRLLGVQFDTLFSNDLYKKIGKHAIDLAEKLKNILHEKNYKFYLESPTNQQFIIIENTKMKELAKNVNFSFWEKYDENHTVVRFATSWTTTEKDLDKLIKLL